MLNYRQCTATSKRTHERCEARAMNGMDVCYHHGGKSLRGIASPTLKTGRYSKYLPENLLDVYEQSESDGELLSIRADIALMDSMIAANLPKLETRESGKAWVAIKKSIMELKKHFANVDMGKCEVTIDEMLEIVNAQTLHYATEQEIRESLDQRRKLSESERKRLVDMQQMVTAEESMLLATALLDSVRRNVTDRGILNAIQSDFIRFTQGANSQRLNAGNDE